MNWIEVNKIRIATVSRMVDKALAKWPENTVFPDFRYCLDALLAAEKEIDRLSTLCREKGLVTTTPTQPKSI